MGGGGGGEGTESLSLQDTPTWALATVCFVFISLGIFIDHLIHLFGRWLKKHRKTDLLEAVEKLKSVLMLLGFMSLLLAATQRPISKICIPNRFANTMLPCRKGHAPTKTATPSEHLLVTTIIHSLSTLRKDTGLPSDDNTKSSQEEEETGHEDDHESDSSDDNTKSHREEEIDYEDERDSSNDHNTKSHKEEDESDSSDHYCGSKGMTSLISKDGLNQLNTFIVVLAIMQVLYSGITMALGRAKMRRWKAWEKETQTVEYMVANDPKRFRFTRETTFGRRHMSGFTSTLTELWIKSFFRQFFHSVAKVDYLTLRHAFIETHLSTNKSFDFRKYIQRSLEEDFRLVVGISPLMWLLVVVFMLVDVHGWQTFLWVSFTPVTIVLILGTKLEVIMARMALQLKERNHVIQGSPLVQPNDNLFWFSRPQLVLTLLHYTLFMNAFELAFFVWVTFEYGIKSCYHQHIWIIVIRVVLAVVVQVICSYITLPLYALVTQMGSQFKMAALEEQTVNALRQWHSEVKEKRKKQPYLQSPPSTPWINSNISGSTNSPEPPPSVHYQTPTDLDHFVSRRGTTNEITQVHEDQFLQQQQSQIYKV